MFKWREKRHGLWPFGCKHNSNMFYDVKFHYAECVKPLNAIPSNELYLILIERGCFTFTVTALVHSLESSCISLKGLDTFDSNTYLGFKCPTPSGKGSSFPFTKRPFWSNSPPSRARTSVKCLWVAWKGGLLNLRIDRRISS